MSHATFSKILLSSASIGARLIGTIVLYSAFGKALGPSQFSDFVFWYAVGLMAVAISDYGFISQILVELGSDYRSDRAKQATQISKAKQSLTLIAVAICSIWSWVDGGNISLWKQLLLMTCAASSLTEFYGTMLRAQGYARYEAMNSALANLSSSLIGALIIINTNNIVLSCSAILLIRAIATSLNFTKARTIYHLDMSLASLSSVSDLILAIRSGLNHAVDSLTQQIYSNFDVFIAKYMAHPYDSGIYLAANRIAQASLSGVSVLTNAFLPSAAQSRKPTASPSLIASSIAFALITLTILYFGSDGIIERIYGSRFSGSEPLLRTLAFMTSFRYVAAMFGIIISARRQQSYRSATYVTAIGVTGALALYINQDEQLKGNEIANLTLLATVLQTIIFSLIYKTQRPWETKKS